MTDRVWQQNQIGKTAVRWYNAPLFDARRLQFMLRLGLKPCREQTRSAQGVYQ
jgi:hypothetical protein